MINQKESKLSLKVHIRWLIRRDFPKVLECQHQTAIADIWEEEDFKIWLRKQSVVGVTAEYNNQVVGFMIYELARNRFNLAHMAVHPNYRRQRVGTQLISKLINKMHSHKYNSIITMTREHDLEYQLFLKSCGFQWYKTIYNVYDMPEEDAYLMKYRRVEK